MRPSAEYIKQLELEYLRILAEKIRSGDIDVNTAQKSAQDLLKLLPFISYEDISTKIEHYIKQYTHLKHLFSFVKKHEKETKTKMVLEKMRTLMKENKLTEAVAVAHST